jgi:hypothetical protein
MQLRANLRLRLNKQQYQLTVRSRTFEKASFDEYLAASIALRTDKNRDANDYIDDITGSGSLNPYLKKMVEKARALPKETLKRIMKDSLFPIEKIDQGQSVSYYPDFDTSIFAGKAYPGDLSRDQEKLKGLVHYEGELASVEVGDPSETSAEDNFMVAFDDSGAAIEVTPSVIAKTSINSLGSMASETPDPYEVPGWYPRTLVDGDGWNGLTQPALDVVKSASGFYSKGDYYAIVDDGLRQMTLAKFGSFYLYKDQRLPFESAGIGLCDAATDKLTTSGAINEFRTKSLIGLLTFSSPNESKEAINAVLSVKESPELAQFALTILTKADLKGWGHNALVQMKRNAQRGQNELLYKADRTLFSLSDLLSLPKSILASEDVEKVEDYERDRQAKIDTIKNIRGELASSSLREDSKLLLSDPEVKEFRKLVNDDVAHNKSDISSVPDQQLDALLQRALRLQELMKIVSVKVAKAKR